MTMYTIDTHVPSTTPSTTPATSSTSTPSTSTPSMTAETPITEQSPVTVPDKAPEQSNSTAVLPADYLAGGYYQGEGKGRYPDPNLIDQAAAIGKALAASGVKAAVLNRMVRTLKAAAKLPYAAQQGALKKLTPIVLDLEHKKKAPPMLREMVERNQAAVKDEADYAACLDHFRDIGIYLTAAQS